MNALAYKPNRIVNEAEQIGFTTFFPATPNSHTAEYINDNAITENYFTTCEQELYNLAQKKMQDAICKNFQR